MTSTDQRSGTTLEHVIGPRGQLSLQLGSGAVSVRGVEGERVRVRSLDGRDLAELLDIDMRDAALELRQKDDVGLSIGLGINIALGRRSHGAELAIEVPHGASVAIQTASADLEASDLSGTKRFRSASGDVRLLRLAGAVDVETVSGEIEMDGAAPVDMVGRSVSGDVEIRVPTIRRLDLGTTSGDIRLDAELAGPGPFALRSISGDVTVVGRSGFRVEAESITGDLSSDMASKREARLGRKVMTIGRPGPTLSFRTVSGDFHVSEPRDAAPAMASGAEQAATQGSISTPERPPERAPTSVRAAGTDTATADSDDETPAATSGADQLAILRALERGEISVAEATDRLNQLDEVLR